MGVEGFAWTRMRWMRNILAQTFDCRAQTSQANFRESAGAHDSKNRQNVLCARVMPEGSYITFVLADAFCESWSIVTRLSGVGSEGTDPMSSHRNFNFACTSAVLADCLCMFLIIDALG